MAIVGPLQGLDPEALRLIKEVAGWKWHPGVYGFVDAFVVPIANQVTRAELVEHHLFDEAKPADRAAGIQWLKERLKIQ
jgi:hypothetical protein